MMQNKTEIFQQLDKIISARLFGDGRWLADREAASALNRALDEMGLQETRTDGSSSDTQLGQELDVALQMVFMGLWEPWDSIFVLQDSGLIHEQEVEPLFALIEMGNEHAEPALRTRVQNAYRDYYQADQIH